MEGLVSGSVLYTAAEGGWKGGCRAEGYKTATASMGWKTSIISDADIPKTSGRNLDDSSIHLPYLSHPSNQPTNQPT